MNSSWDKGRIVKEKYKIYIFSVLSHGVAVGIAYLIIHLIQLARPELGPRLSGPSWLIYSFLTYWGTGIIVVPFLNPYEPSCRYFLKGERGNGHKKQKAVRPDQ